MSAADPKEVVIEDVKKVEVTLETLQAQLAEAIKLFQEVKDQVFALEKGVLKAFEDAKAVAAPVSQAVEAVEQGCSWISRKK
jgi:hypothetical protein